MKIALCLSGQPRFLERGYKYLHDNILSKYNVDVFFHLWFDSKLENTPFSYTIHYSNRNELWRKNLDEIALSLYSPVKYTFESPKEFWFDPQANYELGKTNNCSMFYSMQKANELKMEYEQTNKFKYDLVIRARTDVRFEQFNLDLSSLDPKFVHAFSIGNYAENKISKLLDNTSSAENQTAVIELINDQFAIGGSAVMDAYSSVYNFYNFYWDRDRPTSMNGERVLIRHLLNCRIPIKPYPSGVLHNCIIMS